MKKLIKAFQNAKFPFVMSIITFFVALFFLYLSKGDEWSYRYIILLVGSLPFLCYVIITILSNVFAKRIYIKIIIDTLTFLLTFLLLGYYIMAIFMCTLIETEHPVKNIKNYNDYVKGDYLLNVFPKQVPKNVDDVKLIYSPGLLQASNVIALYYVDDNLDIKYFDDKYIEKSEWVGYKREYSQKEGLLSGMFSHLPIEYENEEEFKIYLIDGSCDDSGYCNHGEFLLVAVNEKTNEVIYKSEDW